MTRRLLGLATLILLTAGIGLNVLSADTKTPPAKPTISSVTVGDRQLTVNWNAATTPSDKPVVDYQVEYRAGSSGDWTNTATYSVSYDSTVQTGPDTTWSHQQDPLELGTPSGGTGGDITAYVAPEPFTTQNGKSRTGLYKVKQAVALMRIQVSGSASVQTTIRLMYSASKPVSLAYSGSELARADSTDGGNAVSLSFVASDLPANSFFWIDGYDRTIESGNLKLTATTISDRRLKIDIATASTALNTNISDLTNQQSYQVRVRARNSDGWGAWSDTSSGTPLGVADAPAGLSSVSGNNQLALSWSAPANTGGYAITDYDIQYRASTGTNTWGSWNNWQGSTVSTATSTTINSGIVNGTSYQVRVRAVNSAGDGDWSQPLTDTAGKPSQPSFALSTVQRPLPAGKSDRGGLLSMVLNAPGNGSAVSDYDLRYRASGTSNWYTYRDRSHDSGRLSGSDTSSNTDPIDFGTFSTPSGAVGVARESLGSGYVYKFSKAVDELWIRASGTISGGGTVVAHWHTSKPTAAQVATLGTQIFSVNTSVNAKSEHTFWQDGWVTNLPDNGYIWFYTTDSETLTKRRLQLDFTDNTAQPPQVNDSGTQRTSETVGVSNNVVDPIDFGAFTTPSGGVAVTRESVSNKAGYYKIGAATERLWIRVSGKFSGSPVKVIACWLTSKPTNPFFDCNDFQHPERKLFTVKSQLVGGIATFDASSWVYNLPANSYIWFYTEGLTTADNASTLTEHRLQLDFDRGRIVLSGLRNGTTYELQARAKNARGWGAWSPSVSGTPGAPTPPEINTLPKNASLDLSWAAPSDNGSAVSGYDVQYRNASSGGWSSWPHAGTTRSATITGLTNNTEYEVRVRARNAVGNGPWSTVKATPIPEKPDAPAAPTLTSSGTTMTVSWTAPLSNGADISDYDIEYSSDNGANWTPHLHHSYASTLTTSDTTTQNVPLDFGTLSPIGLTVTNESVNNNAGVYKVGQTLGALQVHVSAMSTPSGTLNVRYANTKPIAETMYYHGTKLFSLNLNPNASVSGSGTIPAPPANSYFWASSTLELSISTRTISLHWPTVSTSTSDTISGLTNGTAYRVRVRARNSVGTSDWSTAATHAIGRPSPPTAPTLTSKDTKITAKWDAPASPVTIIDYDVRYCSSSCNVDANWTPIADVTNSTSLSETISGLNNGATYYVQVRAEAGVGAGPWSPSASIKAGLPEAPSDIGLESGNDTLVVTWTAPSGNGSLLTGYDFRYSSDSGANWTEVSLSTVPPNPSHSLSGLSNGTTYQVQVRAKNQHGVGPWSDSGTEKPGKPLAPSAPTLTAADHKFLVGWSAATDNGSAISDYDVRYKKSSASNWSEIDDTSDSTDRSVVLTGLEPTETYQVQVRATNTHGDSAWSASSTLKLPVSAVPQQYGVRYCDPASLNQVWVDYDCFIKPGQHGTKPFDAARIASGGDYVELYDYIDSAQTVVALGYNPQGGLAVVETTLNGVVQDTFQIDVIRFSIREVTVTPKTNATGTLTVRLHSPSHGSPDIYEKNGVDYARSWVELSLPGGLRGQSHGSTNLTRTPFQFVGQFGDTITFDLFVLSGGDYTITVNAYRPEPDPDCTGALKCFTPPDPQTQLQYETSVTAQATFAAPNPPAAPTGLTATAGDGSITLNWNDPQNPTISGYEYNVNHNDTGTGNLSGWSAWQSVAGSNAQTTSHTLSGLTNGREYRFHVRAVNAGGAGVGAPNAAPWYVAATPEEPPDPPAAPSSVSTTRADGTLTASWNAPDGATGYEIKYSDDGGSSWQTAASDHTETSIAINVANSSTYIVAVRAGNAGGWSGWRNSSPADPFVPPPTNPPNTVASVSVTRTDGSLTADWDAPDGATKYHVTYTDDGGKSWHAPVDDHMNVPTNSLTFSVDNAKTYIIGVRAGNEIGWSGWRNSPASGAYTPPTPTPTNPPGPVSGFSVTRADGTLTVTWDAPDGATKYHVTYSDDGGKSWHAPIDNHTNVPTNSLSFSVDNAKTYIIGVRAGNEIGWSGWRNSPASGPFTP